MKEELVSLETARVANEKGFTWECERYFNDKDEMWTYVNWGEGLYEGSCFRPTQSLLQKWLRELHNIDVVISPERFKDGVNYCVQAQKWDLSSNPELNPNFIVKGSYWFNDNGEYPTYELALEKGLQEALKLIDLETIKEIKTI